MSISTPTIPGLRSEIPQFNARWFGVKGDGTTDDSAALQSAVETVAAAGGGEVVLTAGTYLLNSTITLENNVYLRGAGELATELKSGAATTLIDYANTDTLTKQLPLVSHMTLNGNSLGTTGMSLRGVTVFELARLWVKNFTTRGLYLQGTPGGVVRTCRFEANAIGCESEYVIQSTFGGMQPNYINFSHCYWHFNTSLAVKWGMAALLHFTKCDFEINGTDGDQNTGVIDLLATMNPNGEGIGCVVDGCWFEANKGHSLVRVRGQSNTRGFALIVRDSLAVVETTTYGLYVEGTGNATRACIDGVTISGPSTSNVYLNGSNATLYKGPSDIGTVGGTGVIIDQVGTDLDFVEAGSALYPVYHNRLNSPHNPQASSIGTGALTLTGATARATGAMPADQTDYSVAFDGVDDYASGTVDLSAYKKIAVEFWMKVAVGTSTNEVAVRHGVDWSATSGGWTIGHGVNPALMYIAIFGNAGLNQANVDRPTQGAWHHYVFIFDQTVSSSQLANIVIDGVDATITRFGDFNNTNSFLSDTLYVGGTTTTDDCMNCNIQDLRIYGRTSGGFGYVPSVAEFQAIYAARSIYRNGVS